MRDAKPALKVMMNVNDGTALKAVPSFVFGPYPTLEQR